MNVLGFMYLHQVALILVGDPPTYILGVSLNQICLIFLAMSGILIWGYRLLGRAYRRRRFRAVLATIVEFSGPGSKQTFSKRGVQL